MEGENHGDNERSVARQSAFGPSRNGGNLRAQDVETDGADGMENDLDEMPGPHAVAADGVVESIRGLEDRTVVPVGSIDRQCPRILKIERDVLEATNEGVILDAARTVEIEVVLETVGVHSKAGDGEN